MIVHKFGGTSVGNTARFAGVADIIKSQFEKKPEQTIVVVSAMSGVTNQLIAGARAAADRQTGVFTKIKTDLLNRHLLTVDELLANDNEKQELKEFIVNAVDELDRLYQSIAALGELTVRVTDKIVSFGEILSSRILAAALRECGMKSCQVSAAELIVTDDTFGAAVPLMDATIVKLEKNLRSLLEEGFIPVVTGFIGATEQGIPTTLGRGGSDFTAALVGAGLKADEVWIWSDVDGILTADPNIVPHARTLAELSYKEAADLAYYGADVLHPKTIRPLVELGIRLRILNSMNPAHPGTCVVHTTDPDREVFPSIITTTGLTMVGIGSVDESWTIKLSAETLERLSNAGVDVLMFSQSFSEHNLILVVRERDKTHCQKILGNELLPGFKLGTVENVATISVVGVPEWNQNGIVSHTFEALGKCGTRVIAVAQAASEYSISFCIPQDKMTETVRFLHRELGLD